MATQRILVADERGFPVPLSLTHPIPAGARAHFTDVLAQLHHPHPATKAAKVTTVASTATSEPTAATAEDSGHEQPLIAATRPRPAYRSLGNGREEPLQDLFLCVHFR